MKSMTLFSLILLVLFSVINAETINSTKTVPVTIKTVPVFTGTYEKCKNNPKSIQCDTGRLYFATSFSSLVQKGTELPCWTYSYKCTKWNGVPTTHIPKTITTKSTSSTKAIPKSTTEIVSETNSKSSILTSASSTKTISTKSVEWCQSSIILPSPRCNTNAPNYMTGSKTLVQTNSKLPCWAYKYYCTKAPMPTIPTSKKSSLKTIPTTSTTTIPITTSSTTTQTYELCKTSKGIPNTRLTCTVPPSYISSYRSLVQTGTEPPCYTYKYTCAKAPMPTNSKVPKSSSSTTSSNTTLKNCTFSSKTVPILPTCSAGYTRTAVTKTLTQQGELCINTTFKCQTVSTKCIPTTISITTTEKETITVRETVTVTITTTETKPPQNCANKWAQCGGQNFNGPTCCQSGSTCRKLNEYYSQCI
ncbi:carbohydrate-binding module family 1 protein [Piromyces sp. E2]|nr:carbohydrate-binding module family 1 protein [Piromyces sp. E2]|eukprot:OUM59064.1 carbohydrate-binding module family 1 protein [Piromyces sp. E2]